MQLLQVYILILVGSWLPFVHNEPLSIRLKADNGRFEIISTRKAQPRWPLFLAVRPTKTNRPPWTFTDHEFTWKFERMNSMHEERILNFTPSPWLHHQEQVFHCMRMGQALSIPRHTNRWQDHNQTGCSTNHHPLINQGCITMEGTYEKICKGPAVAKSFRRQGRYRVTLKIHDKLANEISFRSFRVTVHRNHSSSVEVGRKEVRSHSEKEWLHFVEALYTLKKYGVFDLLVAVHATSMSRTYQKSIPETNVSHGSPAFCPWCVSLRMVLHTHLSSGCVNNRHRMFMRIIEVSLQTFAEDRHLAIPYWNWTIDAMEPLGPKTSNIWSDRYFGPDGNSSTTIVESGPFCSRKSERCKGNWPIDRKLDGPYLKRSLGTQVSVLPYPTIVERMMNQTIYDQYPFTNVSIGFRSSLEGWGSLGHNSVHAFIGGSMLKMTSVNDPIFLFHHAFVDKIWLDWQKKHDCYRSCYAPGDEIPFITVSQSTQKEWWQEHQQWSDTLWPWRVRIKDVSDRHNSQKGYRYI